MNFFDRIPTPEAREPDPVPEPPAWARPETTLGGSVAAEMILARSDDAVVAVSGLTAYPNGFTFDVTAVLRQDDRRGHFFHRAFHPEHFDDETLGPAFLRLGVQFADGSAATNLGDRPPFGADDPSGPLLMTEGGGGGGRRYDMSYWVWPLPPPGPLTFVCEWPAFGIPESRADLDAQAVLDAAGRAVPLWPSTPDSRNIDSGRP